MKDRAVVIGATGAVGSAPTQALYPKISWMLPSRFQGIRVEELGRAIRLNAELPSGRAVEALHYGDFLRISR